MYKLNIVHWGWWMPVWLSLAACSSSDTAQQQASEANKGLKLYEMVLEKTPLERMVDGTIEAINQATVSAQTSGRVVELFYDVNDFVPAGAVIMRLRATEQRAGLQQIPVDLHQRLLMATQEHVGRRQDARPGPPGFEDLGGIRVLTLL